MIKYLKNKKLLTVYMVGFLALASGGLASANLNPHYNEARQPKYGIWWSQKTAQNSSAPAVNEVSTTSNVTTSADMSYGNTTIVPTTPTSSVTSGGGPIGTYSGASTSNTINGYATPQSTITTYTPGYIPPAQTSPNSAGLAAPPARVYGSSPCGGACGSHGEPIKPRGNTPVTAQFGGYQIISNCSGFGRTATFTATSSVPGYIGFDHVTLEKTLPDQSVYTGPRQVQLTQTSPGVYTATITVSTQDFPEAMAAIFRLYNNQGMVQPTQYAAVSHDYDSRCR